MRIMHVLRAKSDAFRRITFTRNYRPASSTSNFSVYFFPHFTGRPTRASTDIRPTWRECSNINRDVQYNLRMFYTSVINAYYARRLLPRYCDVDYGSVKIRIARLKIPPSHRPADRFGNRRFIDRWLKGMRASARRRAAACKFSRRLLVRRSRGNRHGVARTEIDERNSSPMHFFARVASARRCEKL